MKPIIHKRKLNGKEYSIDQATIDSLRDLHGVDAIVEVENAILQATKFQHQLKLQKDNNESTGT